MKTTALKKKGNECKVNIYNLAYVKQMRERKYVNVDHRKTAGKECYLKYVTVIDPRFVYTKTAKRNVSNVYFY